MRACGRGRAGAGRGKPGAEGSQRPAIRLGKLALHDEFHEGQVDVLPHVVDLVGRVGDARRVLHHELDELDRAGVGHVGVGSGGQIFGRLLLRRLLLLRRSRRARALDLLGLRGSQRRQPRQLVARLLERLALRLGVRSPAHRRGNDILLLGDLYAQLNEVRLHLLEASLAGALELRVVSSSSSIRIRSGVGVGCGLGRLPIAGGRLRGRLRCRVGLRGGCGKLLHGEGVALRAY